MKVLILGGTGVFGSRLARMLLQDRFDVVVASRSKDRAQAFTDAFGGTPLALERSEDPTPYLDGVFAFVDAAGPFQDYQDYQLAEHVLAAGVHYLDLSDDGAFTAGISKLDTLATKHTVSALSGVSSVPALSSAVVTALAPDLRTVDCIETAILPGNRAPRGLAVMQSILGQIGATTRIWQEDKWTEQTGWSSAKTYELEPGLTRRAALIGAPDLMLFPEHFKARTVVFRAGLELQVMQRSLDVLSWARRRRLIGNPVKLARLLRWGANWLEPFGSDRGGMQVTVSGQTTDGTEQQRTWSLIAEAGDGPFIPAVPAVILLKKLVNGDVPSGSRPCLAEFTLCEAEAELNRRQVRCLRTDKNSLQ